MNQLQFAQYYDNYMMDQQYGGWGFMVMFFFILLVIAFVIFIVRSNNSSSQKNTASPLDVAKSRYAKGDITKAQFHELKKDLKD